MRAYRVKKFGAEAEGPTLAGGRGPLRTRCWGGGDGRAGVLKPKKLPIDGSASTTGLGFFGFGGATGAMTGVMTSGPTVAGDADATGVSVEAG